MIHLGRRPVSATDSPSARLCLLQQKALMCLNESIFKACFQVFQKEGIAQHYKEEAQAEIDHVGAVPSGIHLETRPCQRPWKSGNCHRVLFLKRCMRRARCPLALLQVSYPTLTHISSESPSTPEE